MTLTRTLLVIAILATTPTAHAKGFCGFAYNFANQAQAKVHVKGFKVTGTDVQAQLVCSKWHSICNGKVGKIHAVAGTYQGTDIPSLNGSLAYGGTKIVGTKIVCGVYCQVDGTLADPSQLICQFNCPDGSNAVQVSFTVGKTVCQPGPYH
jgi:hypothetical protein